MYYEPSQAGRYGQHDPRPAMVGDPMKNEWEYVERGRYACSWNGHLLEVIRNPDKGDARKYISCVDHKPVGDPSYNLQGAKSRAMHAAGGTSRPQKPKGFAPSWAAKIQPDIELGSPELTVRSVEPELPPDRGAEANAVISALSRQHTEPQPDVGKDAWLDRALGLDASEPELAPEPAPELPVDHELEQQLEAHALAERQHLEAERNALAHPQPAAHQLPAERDAIDDAPTEMPANLVHISLRGRLQPTTKTLAVLGQIEAAVALLRELAEHPDDIEVHLDFPGGIRL